MDILELLPEVVGASIRQVWYAKQLRQKYIEQHEERFNDIYEQVTNENDHRSLNYDDKYLSTYDLDFDEEEMCVLYATKAGGIIATLKEAVEW